jgi:hypothetical protein
MSSEQTTKDWLAQKLNGLRIVADAAYYGGEAERIQHVLDEIDAIEAAADALSETREPVVVTGSEQVTVTLCRKSAELNLRRFPTEGVDSGLGLDQRELRDALGASLAAIPRPPVSQEKGKPLSITPSWHTERDEAEDLDRRLEWPPGQRGETVVVVTEEYAREALAAVYRATEVLDEWGAECAEKSDEEGDVADERCKAFELARSFIRSKLPLDSTSQSPVPPIGVVEAARILSEPETVPSQSPVPRFTLDEIRQVLSLRDVVLAVARARWERLGRAEQFDDLSFVRHSEGILNAQAEIDSVLAGLATAQPTPEEAGGDEDPVARYWECPGVESAARAVRYLEAQLADCSPLEDVGETVSRESAKLVMDDAYRMKVAYERVCWEKLEVERERDSRLTKEQVREKLAAEIPTWFQSWIDHHKAEQELAANSDDSVAAKQHEVAADAFEDAIRYALQAADAAFGEVDSDA